MEADHWFRQVGKILEAVEITSDATRIRLAVFQLEGESQVWWVWVKASRNLKAMTWVELCELFMGKFFLAFARRAKAREFLELKQGTMTMLEYVAKFNELTRFTNVYVAMDMAKVRKFEDGLKLSIWGKIVGLLLQDMDSMVMIAMAIEREVDDTRSIQDVGASDKWNESQLFYLARERRRGLLLREGFRDRFVTTRAKARISHPKMGDSSRLLARHSRERVSSATILDT